MYGLSIGSSILVLVAAAFTAVAAGWDLRTRRIPNKLTFPVFLAGWVYQGIDRGWTGLGDAALGFLVGFGILFVLWMVGGGGGGDVKLMGALSVWLGFRLTLLVMIASTGIVLMITFCVFIWTLLTRGIRASRDKYLATGKLTEKQIEAGKKQSPETTVQKQHRRVLPYAVPVAVATWLVMFWKLPTLDNPVRGQTLPAQQQTEAAR
ncbi:MAG: prepilin peptidase [Planctomycetaceae bacterium]